MTPRINESNIVDDLSSFSSELFSQVNQVKSGHKLDGSGDIFELWHPALLKCRNMYQKSPLDLTLRQESSHWHVIAFKDQSEAEEHASPGIKTYYGFPCDIYQFLKDGPDKAIIHFGKFGSVQVSKNSDLGTLPQSIGLHHHLLPLWLDYALSPELWGPKGKWVRFHERLHTLFDHYGLFVDTNFPGFYPLKKEAQWLSEFGFQGRLNQTSFDLIMPWDFPLSGLNELEKVLARGR